MFFLNVLSYVFVCELACFSGEEIFYLDRLLEKYIKTIIFSLEL